MIFGTSLYAIGLNQDNSIFLESYIANKGYPKILISNTTGNLVNNQKVIDYHPKWLYEFYLSKICSGLYIASCNYNRANIKTDMGIDLSSESGLITENFESVYGYKVVYTTKDLYNRDHHVSGAVLIPNSMNKLKGIVLFYRYTILDKNNIPSNFLGDEFQLSRLMASTLASDGYVVVMPDYLGSGIDANSVHPYILYPEINALSGIYMLKALNGEFGKLNFDQHNGKTRLFISGYSEGGAYALWATKILQDNPGFMVSQSLTLTKTVPIVGAYNLSKVTLPYVLQNIDKSHKDPYSVENWRVAAFVKPGLLAHALDSYSYYSLPGTPESQVLNSKFIACDGCVVAGRKYTLPELIQSAPLRDGYKYSLLYQAALSSGYSRGENSVISITNPQIFSDPKFVKAVENADIYNWRSKTPISFLAFEHDSVVPTLNSETAFKAMTDSGSSWVKITRVPNQDFKVSGYLPWTDIDVDHPQGISFMLLFARKEFNESLKDEAAN